MNKNDLLTLQFRVNYNKKVVGPIFKDKQQGFRMTEFVRLPPQLYCIHERDGIQYAAKGASRSVLDSMGNGITIKSNNA